jgi:hypothetical protein
LDEPNPFISEDEVGEVASVAYRYRKWDLDGGVVLVARCEHDAVTVGSAGDNQFINIKALNEWDSRVSKLIDCLFSHKILVVIFYFLTSSCLAELNGVKNWTRNEVLFWPTN